MIYIFYENICNKKSQNFINSLNKPGEITTGFQKLKFHGNLSPTGLPAVPTKCKRKELFKYVMLETV